jgi:predicted nuclease of predicted toxin-antitoxin system
MNFLADENFPLISIKILEDHDHKVKSVFLLMRGAPDIKVLTEAIQNDEYLITFDKDFGEMIFKNNLPYPPGIILFRLNDFEPGDPAKILLSLIKENKISLTGYLTVITKNKTRQKKLSK